MVEIVISAGRPVCAVGPCVGFAEVPVGVNRPGNAGRGILDAPGIGPLRFLHLEEIPDSRARQHSVARHSNFLNHANFNAPNVALSNSGFRGISTARDPRQIQIAAKLAF